MMGLLWSLKASYSHNSDFLPLLLVSFERKAKRVREDRNRPRDRRNFRQARFRFS